MQKIFSSFDYQIEDDYFPEKMVEDLSTIIRSEGEKYNLFLRYRETQLSYGSKLWVFANKYVIQECKNPNFIIWKIAEIT